MELSLEALELTENNPAIKECVTQMTFENVHLVAEVMISGKPNVGKAFIREIMAQAELKGIEWQK